MKNVGLLYQTIDTWSFGCVLSETATWVVKGETGINDYRKLRELNPEKQKHEDVTDTFHDGSDVLPEIKEWHKVLKTVRRISDSITPKILDLVDEKMLIKNPKARIPSNELYDSLREIISRAEKSERSEPGPAGKESLVMAKSALLSTELARQSTIQSESGRFVKLDHVIDDLHDTQRFPMSPPPVILALFRQFLNDENHWNETSTAAGLRYQWVQEQFLLLIKLFIRNNKLLVWLIGQSCTKRHVQLSRIQVKA